MHLKARSFRNCTARFGDVSRTKEHQSGRGFNAFDEELHRAAAAHSEIASQMAIMALNSTGTEDASHHFQKLKLNRSAADRSQGSPIAKDGNLCTRRLWC
jgi:hypothetical protein